MSSKRRSNRQFTAIGDVLAEVLNGYRRKSSGDLSRVCRLWESTVGAAIAENTRPVAMKGKQLVVVVTSSAWLHQLQFLKEQMVDGINRQTSENLVEDIKFRIGSF